MKVETYKGVVIMHDSQKNEYYTEVVMRKRTRTGNQYTASKKIQTVKSEIDRFLNSLGKKVFQKAWIRGCYEDGRYKLVEIIFQNNLTNIVTVRDKGGKIATIALSEYKFDEDKIFIDSRANRTIIADMEGKQQLLEKLRKERAALKLKLSPLKSKLLK